MYRDEDIVFRIIVDPNTGERAVKQVYAHGELAVDDPVVFSDCPNTVCSSGGRSFFTKDQVQSVESLFNPDTFTNQTQYYSSFGFSLTNTTILFSYTSKENETYYILGYRSRMYIPSSGLFTEKESIEINEINQFILQVLTMLYGYVSPVNEINSYGLRGGIFIKVVMMVKNFRV